MEYSRKKQNGVKSGEDIMMNLLEASSDSDPEPLNLPPLKGKKPTKRKRSYGSSSANNEVCDFCYFMKIVAVILMICLLALLGVLTMLLYKQIGDIRQTIDSVERKNKDSLTDLGQYQQQIDDLKKSVESSNSDHSNKFIQLNNTIKDLKKSSENMKSLMNVDSIKKLKEQLNQLEQIPVLSQSVAKIGADVKDLKTKVDELKTFKETAEKQINDIVQKNVQSDDRESNHFDSGESLEKLIALQKTVGDLNITMWKRMDMMDDVLSSHKTRFEMLDNKTANLQVQLQQYQGSEINVHPAEEGQTLEIPESVQNQIEDKIKAYVQQVLSNNTEETSSDSSLNGILSNMDNITAMVKNLKDQFVQLKADHSGMIQPVQSGAGDNTELVEFKNTALDRLEKLNQTVDHLSQDVSILMHKFIINQNTLTNLTGLVDGIRRYISILEIKIGNQTVKSDDPELVNIPKAENISVNVDKQNTPGTTIPPTTTTVRPIIHMKLIDSEDKVDLNLHRWDHNGNGVLDTDEIEDLGDFMLDPPTPEQIKMFDFDHSGTIDESELKIALGFKPYPTEEQRQKLADLG